MPKHTENKLHKHLEQDIERLGQEVDRARESQESHVAEKKEIIKQSFEALAEQETDDSGPDYTAEDRKAVESEFFPDYMNTQDVPDEVKLEVERLLDLVFHQGLIKALRLSKKEPAFIQDAFHDALAEKLVPVLEERELI